MEIKKINTNKKISKEGENNIRPKTEFPKESNIQNNNKNDILKVLIYIYYYEKNVLNVENGIKFNRNEKYYLIKTTWIKEFKKYYDYNNISKYLDNYALISKNKKKIPINLNHLSDNKLLERIKIYLNNFNSYLLSKQLKENLKDSNISIFPTKSKNNFIYYSSGYIIDSKILEIFENYIFEGQKIKIKPINIFNKENNIFLSFLINKPNVFVTIGNLNSELIFTGNSCIWYYNLKTFEIEKNILLNKSFKDYIISRKCQENDLNVQTLKKEENKKLVYIGQFFIFHLNDLNSNIRNDKRVTSSKPLERKLIDKSTDIYSTNNSTLNRNEQSFKKIIDDNDLIRRNQTHFQTPKNVFKPKMNMNNNNIQEKSNILSTIQEEFNKVQKNSKIKLQNIGNNTGNNKQNEQVKLLTNELKNSKNKKFIAQLSEEKRNLMEKDKNQEQLKILNSSKNIKGNEKDEKNKNCLNEKEVVRLDNLLSNKREHNIDHKELNENIELKSNNEELKKVSRQKDEQIQKLKNENQKKMKEKDEENKKLKQLLNNLQKDNQSLKNNEKESQKKINSMIDDQKKKDDDINELNKKYNEIQMKLENQENAYNKLKEKEDEELTKINQLQNQLKEKDETINNITGRKDEKVEELEKEILSLKNMLNDQLERDKEIEKLKKELNDKNNLIKENRQKNEQIQNIKNENKLKIKEKEEENKKLKEVLDNLQKDYHSLKNNEKESQNIINSMIDQQNKKGDEFNELKQKYNEIQKELENQENAYNQLKEKEVEESKKIYQLQSQLDEKDEKNKYILNEKEVKIEELEKKISSLKNLLNNQTERENKIDNLNNENNKLKSEIANKDNQIKMRKVEIENNLKNKENELTNKINENIKLKSNNEELKKESKQKDEQIQKLKNEYQLNIEEKEKEIKKLKQLLNNLQKEDENLKINNLKESQKIINSMIEEQKKKDDELNDLNKNYQSIQMELEKEKSAFNKSEKKYKNVIKEKDQLQKQLSEKEGIINSLNKRIKSLESLKNDKEKKKKELNEQIFQKEKEINDKISFLEDKENMIENENKKFIDNKKQNEELKKENIKLINKNKELENQIKDKLLQINQNNYNINRNQNSLLNNAQSNQIINYNVNNIQRQNQEFQNPIPNPNDYPPKEKDPLKDYNEPTLIGLNNIGATCFMNSTLQCLSQTAYLTNYFLKDSKYTKIMNNNTAKQNKNLTQLSPVYLELIKNLWDKNKKGTSFSPNKFMETVEKMNPLFKQGQAGDSKDFIIFILEQIHKELKNPIASQNQAIAQPLNQYDRNSAFTFFMNDFKKECSIISDVFFGFTETTNICLYCKSFYSSQGMNYPVCYNYGIFNCLIFPLEEVKNFRNNYWANLNIQINQNNIVTLSECFFYNQKTEMFTGDNRNYCNICKQLYDSEYTNRIYSSPNVLILILNRGKDNKYNIKLDFTETFDLTQFVVVKDRPQLIYNLNGVITHFGQSGPNAHFIGFCKSPINDKWYKYNDALVNPVEDVQKEIINFGTPYILFYQKSKI